MAAPERRPGEEAAVGVPAPEAGKRPERSGAGRPHGHEHHSLRERVADLRWRRRLAARGSVNHSYRVTVGAVGGTVVVLGLVTIPLPGPGWLTVIAGLFLLATEFTWAERLLDFTKRHVRRWTEWVTGQAMWVRVLFSLLTAAFVYGVLVVTLHMLGVPDWVPGWVPLWR